MIVLGLGATTLRLRALFLRCRVLYGSRRARAGDTRPCCCVARIWLARCLARAALAGTVRATAHDVHPLSPRTGRIRTPS